MCKIKFPIKCFLNYWNWPNINIFRGVNGIKPDEVEEALNIFGNPKFDIYCSKGNIGCNLSMLKVFKHIVDNKIPIATIFEDDIVFHPEWSTIASKFYENTPKNFDILYMGNQIEECYIINNIPRINKKSCFCMHSIVVTFKGANKLLNLVLIKWMDTLDFGFFHQLYFYYFYVYLY